MSADKNMTLNDRYKLIEKIGRGGMAEVWLAHDKTLERQVAVKVMLPEFASDPDFARRFKLEAAAAANLHSPYIVNVYDWGHDGNIQYMVMEYVRGSDLKSIIEDKGPLTPRQAAKVGAQVCEALAAAHHQDLIHRDIKPQNIMIQPDGNIKVMDFGIARAKNSTEQKTQMVLGTAHYISPEQAQGKDLTAASDLYSLGIVLYEAVSGKVPFDGPDSVSVALKQVEEQAVSLAELVPGVDQQFADLIAVAMEKQPNKRFASALDMGHLLDDYAHNRKSFSNATTQLMSETVPQNMNSAEGYNAVQTAMMPNSEQNPGLTEQNDYISSEEVEDEKKSKLKVALIILGTLLVIGGIIFAVMNLTKGPDMATVPDLEGMTQEEAVKVLEENDLALGEIKNIPSSDVPAGHIIKTDPEAGTEVVKDSKVVLEISSGVEQVQIPNLHNMEEAQAIKALEDVGLKGIRGPSQHSTEVAEGHVMAQDPAGGLTVDAGTVVTYVVSSGKENPLVPDLSNMTEEEAVKILEGMGLKALIGSRQSSDSVSAGLVISQNPNAGLQVTPGTQVTLVISTGVAEVDVPSLTGLSRAAARSTLVNAGLTLGNVSEEYSNEPLDSVISQSISYGTAVAKGTAVDIVLSKGPEPEPEPEPTPKPSNSNTTPSNTNQNTNQPDEGDNNNNQESEPEEPQGETAQ